MTTERVLRAFVEWLRTRIKPTEEGQRSWETWWEWVEGAPLAPIARSSAPPKRIRSTPAEEAAAAAAFMAQDGQRG